jgi:hypothetical protein
MELHTIGIDLGKTVFHPVSPFFKVISDAYLALRRSFLLNT